MKICKSNYKTSYVQDMPKIIPVCLWLGFLLFFSKPYSADAQLKIWPYLKYIELSFPEDVNNRIEDIYQQKDKSFEIISLLSEESGMEVLEEAFSSLFASSNELYEIYDRYSKNILSELPKPVPAEFDRPFEFERRAELNMKKAGIIRNEAQKAEGFAESFRLYEMAFDLEMTALLNKGRALRIYQDYPIIYEYPWDEDFTVMDSSPVRALRVIEIDHDHLEKDIEAADLTEKEGISFIIQIAAHSEKLSEAEIKSIYSGDMDVNMIFEDNWYKYYLGPYERYEEAEKVNKNLNIRNTFIAAYMDGKRLSVGEAKRRQAQPD